jgi:hypothetical protein
MPDYCKPQKQKVPNPTKSLSLNRYGNTVLATLQLNNIHYHYSRVFQEQDGSEAVYLHPWIKRRRTGKYSVVFLR